LDLQVHVTGPKLDTLQIFFRDELKVDVVDGSSNLHLGRSIVLAPVNPNSDKYYGTFAVRYGPHQDTFKVYGWKTSVSPTACIIHPPITLEPGSPVCLHWVTSRVLKVTYGLQQEKTYVIRFNDAQNPWTVLPVAP
jgi:hypothetical protein